MREDIKKQMTQMDRYNPEVDIKIKAINFEKRSSTAR
jgi:hypothetical protein